MFKVGDKVVRLTGSYGGMDVGETGIVSRVDYASNGLAIEGYYESGHDPCNFKLYEEPKENNMSIVKSIIKSTMENSKVVFEKGMYGYGRVLDTCSVFAMSLVVNLAPYVDLDKVTGEELFDIVSRTLHIVKSHSIEDSMGAVYSSIQFFLKEE